MAGTKSRRPTVKLVLKWIKQGFGQGTANNYKPFFFVRDVPSVGSSNMIHSPNTGRIHHYLSTLEFWAHLIAEFSKDVIDIREQYALLPWTETQDTARKLGIVHPKYVGTDVPVVMTTDILISKKQPDGVQLIAIAVKPEADLDERTMEKLLLERMYWNRRGVTWILLTDREIPQPLAQNLQFFEMALQNLDQQVKGVSSVTFSECIEEAWRADATLFELIADASAKLKISNNEGTLLLGQAVWRHQSRLDLNASQLAHTAPFHLKQVAQY